MKNIVLLVVLLQSFIGISQTKNFKISYLKSSNDKVIENQDTTIVYVNEKQCLISSKKIINNKAEFPFEQTLVQGNILFQMASLNSNKIIFSIDSTSISKQKLELTNETKKILGFTCKKATTIINSNRIDIWYTNDLPLKGGPSALGQNLGLVLETNRNGNFLVTAIKIEKTKNFPKLNAIENRKNSLDNLTYRDLLWKSRYTTIPIFKEEIINYSDASKSNDSVIRYGNGTIALRKIKFPKINAGSEIFIDLTEQSNGDAYDRTGSVFVIPTNEKLSFLDGLKNGAKELPIYTNENGKEYQGVVATNDFLPLVELMRFFTPFGIKQYNYLEMKDKKWFDAVSYRQDISDLRTMLSNNEVWIGTFIGNYDKGGHKISENITIHNEEGIKASDLQIIPLFNTVNVMEMSGQNYGTMFSNDKGLEVHFTLDKNLKNVKLKYISTGHGGWENGDEFVPKKNTIFLNGKEVFHFTPWRQDCGSYRLYNPASGNSTNGLTSSDYSRANWCPGMATNPTYIDLGDLSAGDYTIQVKIPQGESEGGSFSSWNVSGVLIGE